MVRNHVFRFWGLLRAFTSCTGDLVSACGWNLPFFAFSSQVMDVNHGCPTRNLPFFAFPSHIMDVNHGCPMKKRHIIKTTLWLRTGSFVLWFLHVDETYFSQHVVLQGLWMYKSWMSIEEETPHHWDNLGLIAGYEPLIIHQLGYLSWLCFLHAKNHPMDGAYPFLACNNFQCW